MAEENQSTAIGTPDGGRPTAEKKKLGKIKLILKWIGLGLLTLLIILAIIFQAPWKITALLIIILFACIILPKAYRKWFWLSVGAVVIAIIIWVFLPEDNQGWRPYTFDEEIAALEAKYSIPDEENAAVIYNQLLEDYDREASYDSLPVEDQSKLPISEPWLSKDYPKIAEWIKANQNIIDGLIKASEISQCRFSISAPNHFEKQMSRNAAMRRWAFLLVSAASNDIGEGRINQAVEEYIALLQMGKHLCQQTTMIDMLVGIAIEALVTNQLKTFIVMGDASEEHLNVIENALAGIKHDWSSDFPRFLEGEKLVAKNMLCGMLYEVNPQGKIRFIRDPRKAIKYQFAKDMSPITYWQKKLIKAGIIWAWFIVPPTPQSFSGIIDTAYENYYAMAEPGFDWEKEPGKFSITSIKLNFRRTMEMMSHTVEPAYHKIHDTYLRHTTNQTGVRLIIALRHYKNKTGHWPSLDEIKPLADPNVFIDPINGGNFVYKLTEEDFMLYSKGKNNIDEGGKRDYRWTCCSANEGEVKCAGERAGADDILIWPPKLPKTQGEKIDEEHQ